MTQERKILLVLLLIILAVTLPPLGRLLEQSMLTHVLIQIPLLVLAGFILGWLLEGRLSTLQKVNEAGIPGILLATFIALYWMLPRVLDASINDPLVAVFKYLSLPLLLGLPLQLSWSRLHFVAKGVIKLEFLAMLLRLGWLYLVSPVRLCNVYGLKEQILLGKGLLVIALLLSIYWTLKLFFGNSRQSIAVNKPLSDQLV